MNLATYFQKHNSRIFQHLQRNYIRLFVKGNSGRIKWLRNAGARIGSNVTIHNVNIFGTEPWLVEVGDGCYFSGSDILLITHDGGIGKLFDMGIAPKSANSFGRIRIGNNCFIGAKTIVLKGVTIGENCIIGAGSIVTKDVPANSVACGVPARVIESCEEYYKKNEDKLSFTKGCTLYEKRMIHESEQIW